MATTLITLGVAQEGKLRYLNVQMSAEDLRTSLIGAGSLVALPTGDGEHIYVNPAYVVLARETTHDEPPG